MKEYNENTLPILKYLRWRRELKDHPDFIRARKKAMTMDVSDLVMKNPFPLLWPKSCPLKTDDMNAANDAVFGLSRVWPWFAEAASSRIEAVSKTFVTAMDNSYEAFLKADLFKELENRDLQGTLIFPGGEVICYDFIMQCPEETDGKLTYLVSGNAIRLLEGKHLVCDHFDDIDMYGMELETSSWHDFEKMEWKMPNGDPENREDTVGEWLEKKGIKFELKITDGINENVMGMFDCILVYHLFKKYAPIEEVVSVRERREHRDLPEIRTTQKIDYLDCSWYTTIIRNEGFNVRGHFRLQPCGKGKQDKKLIYIHEFRKHGYIRRARLMLEETRNDR
jgi:hypothetical protein